MAWAQPAARSAVTASPRTDSSSTIGQQTSSASPANLSTSPPASATSASNRPKAPLSKTLGHGGEARDIRQQHSAKQAVGVQHAHGLGVVDQPLHKEVGHAARDRLSGDSHGGRTPLAATPPLHTASNRSLVVRTGRVARLLRPLCARRWCRTPAVQPTCPYDAAEAPERTATSAHDSRTGRRAPFW